MTDQTGKIEISSESHHSAFKEFIVFSAFVWVFIAVAQQTDLVVDIIADFSLEFMTAGNIWLW